MTIERLLPRRKADELRFLAYELERRDMATPSTTCDECKSVLPLKVCQGGAGFYLGYICKNCGPYARMSTYFKTREGAEAALTIVAEIVGDIDGDFIDPYYLAQAKSMSAIKRAES
jgi:hypothetical protein